MLKALARWESFVMHGVIDHVHAQSSAVQKMLLTASLHCQSTERIGSALMLETCGCAHSLDWSQHWLMLVMLHRNFHHAPCSAVMPAAAIKESRQRCLDRWVVTSAATWSFHCFLGTLVGQRQPSGRSAYRSCFGKRESSIRQTCPNHQRWFHWTHFPMAMQRCRIMSLRSWLRRVTPSIQRRQLI